MRFVVADDDDSARLLISRILKRAFIGCEIREFQSAEEALPWIVHESLDAIITDFNMPRMSGALLALELRRKQDSTPIVVLSSSDQGGMAAIEAGADAYLTKDRLSTLPQVIRSIAPGVDEKCR